MSNPTSAYNELISAQLRKATSELRQLQQLLTQEGIDPRVLLDFRDAVDNVRHVAWAVQQWLDLHQAKRDVSGVMAVLAAHRVRVGTQLSNDLALSLRSGEVSRFQDDLQPLKNAVRRLLQSLDAVPDR